MRQPDNAMKLRRTYNGGKRTEVGRQGGQNALMEISLLSIRTLKGTLGESNGNSTCPKDKRPFFRRSEYTDNGSLPEVSVQV